VADPQSPNPNANASAIKKLSNSDSLEHKLFNRVYTPIGGIKSVAFYNFVFFLFSISIFSFSRRTADAHPLVQTFQIGGWKYVTLAKFRVPVDGIRSTMASGSSNL